MKENNENDTTHKSEINATMAFTQSLPTRRRKTATLIMTRKMADKVYNWEFCYPKVHSCKVSGNSNKLS